MTAPVLQADWARHDMGGVVASLRLDGTRARYRVLVSDAPEPEIGTYEAVVARELADAARTALAAVVAERDGTVPTGPHTIRAGLAGQAGVEVSAGDGGAGGRLADALDAIATACRSAPAATCDLHARLLDGSGTLEVAVAATGSQPVSLLLNRDATAIIGGDEWPHGRLADRAIWSATGAALLGFRGSDRTLLDGIYVPATIAPGDVGRMHVPDVGRSGSVSAGALMVLGGVVHAPLEQVDDPFPEDTFTLVAPITRAAPAP